MQLHSACDSRLWLLQVEKLVPCQLSAYQRALCQLVECEMQTEEACKPQQAFKNINNTLMELRTICNHPLIRYQLLQLAVDQLAF